MSKLSQTFWNTLSFILLMAAIQVMRPIKDNMAIIAGLDSLPHLITFSFITIFVGSLLLMFTKGHWGFLWSAVGVPLILVFGNFLDEPLAASITYILFSAASLLILSQYWRSVSESINQSSAKSLYSQIITFGVLGSISGSILVILVTETGSSQLLYPLTCIFLMSSVVAVGIGRSFNFSVRNERNLKLNKSEGSNFKFVGFILLYSLVATFLYYQQLEIVQAYQGKWTPQTIFATRDLVISLLTLALGQYFLKNGIRAEKHIGLMPILSVWLFIVVLLVPTLFSMLFVVVIFRAGNFSVTKPGRETYYRLRPGMNKYKGLVDATIYRSGDIIGAWFFLSLKFIGANHVIKSLAILPIVILWYYFSKKVSLVLNC